MNNSTSADTFLPSVRCSAELRARIERIAERSVSKRLSDHLRLAVERYVSDIEAAEATHVSSSSFYPISN